MASTLDPHTTESKARELLDSRIKSVRALVTARQALDELRGQLSAAEAADVKAYRAALSDGWSADELRKLGLDEPDKKQRVRRRAASHKTAPFDPANTPRRVGADAAADSAVSP
jgi:hypothetical protein